ncbi:isochorismatase family protein [Bacillus atrophaeus]|uniref:isochorismatase family protein n=1 Tax=Bacillus atrophaeus TaxID=1452 RepID=UPI00227F6E3E|nr:isochorismatase family protein [Bacillus atrophaeus]MCY8934666.1 isochorismatase family protein [Bacillus atrophaeus]MCY8944284.1 isochorismatase family protein [Bacillus atrophaeus]
MKQALIVIDMQEIFFSEEQNYLYQHEQLLENVNMVIDWARKKAIPVIFIQHTDQNPSDEMAKGKYAWELHKGLHRISSDIVIEKITWDSFYQTILEKTLKNLGIEQLIFAGAQTEFCLDTTMRIAYSKGYQQNLLVEGTHSTLNSNQLSAEQIMKHHESVWNNRFVQIHSIDLYKL